MLFILPRLFTVRIILNITHGGGMEWGHLKEKKIIWPMKSERRREAPSHFSLGQIIFFSFKVPFHTPLGAENIRICPGGSA
jgi:hypothetical protein